MKILYPGRLTIIHTTITIVVLLVLCSITGCKVDFTGGKEWTLQVDTGQAVKGTTFYERHRLMNLLKESGIASFAASLKDELTIEISGLSPQDAAKVKEILEKNFMEWDHQIAEENATLSLKQNAVDQLKEQAILQALEVIKKRLSMFELRKEYIERETPGSDRLKLRIPPIKNPGRIINAIRMGGILEMRPAVSGPFATEEEALSTFNGTLPADLEIQKTNPQGVERAYYVVNAYPLITGRDLEKAQPSKDYVDAPAIAFTLTPEGAAKFRTFTGANIGQKLAIILDNKIISVPVIQAVISNEGVITGNFTIEEAEDLVCVLNAGGLPAPLKILEEKIIEAK